MSCGCSNFDGRNELDGLDLASEEMLNASGKTHHRSRILKFSGEDEFDYFDAYNNFEDDAYTDFVDDGEEDSFDNFLTKKMRERRKLRKGLEESGLSKTEARKQALAQIPRDKLKTILANLKAKRNTTAQKITVVINLVVLSVIKWINCSKPFFINQNYKFLRTAYRIL